MGLNRGCVRVHSQSSLNQTASDSVDKPNPDARSIADHENGLEETGIPGDYICTAVTVMAVAKERNTKSK